LLVGANESDYLSRVSYLGSKIIPDIHKKLGISASLFPIHEIGYNEFICNKNGSSIRYTLQPGMRAPKGFNVTNMINSMETHHSKPDYFVYCDGSGRIPFENISRLLERLKSDSVDCILSTREPWRDGISSTRKIIEEFESWLVCDYARIDGIRDLQCGLWGFKVNNCSTMRIEAIGYEIELNVALEAIRCGKSIGEMKVNIAKENTTSTSFPEDYSRTGSHFQKLHYLGQYLCLSTEDIQKRADHYNARIADEDKKLPKAYLEMIDHLSPEMQPPSIREI
jgi:hypothetical protein